MTAEGFVTIEGHRLRYLSWGAGPPALLVHGFAGMAEAWAAVGEDLSRDHAVYALDLLGFGGSDMPARADSSLAGHGRRVALVAAALDLHNVMLAGHSMGGVVAAFASLADGGERIGRLALLSANFYRRNGPPFPIFPPLPRLLAARFYSPAARAASLRRCYADQSLVTPELIERYLRPTRAPGARASLATFLATPGPATYAQLPAQLRRPALALWGAEDALWPLEDARRLHAEVAGSRLQIVPGAGHMLQEERPAEVAAQLRAFAAH